MPTFGKYITLLDVNKSHYCLSNQILNHFSANQDEFDGKIAEIACTIGSKNLEANTPASPRALVPKAMLGKFSNVIRILEVL